MLRQSCDPFSSYRSVHFFLFTSSVHGNDVTYWDTKMAFTSASILSRGVDFYNYLLKEHFKEDDWLSISPRNISISSQTDIWLVFPVLWMSLLSSQLLKAKSKKSPSYHSPHHPPFQSLTVLPLISFFVFFSFFDMTSFWKGITVFPRRSDDLLPMFLL